MANDVFPALKPPFGDLDYTKLRTNADGELLVAPGENTITGEVHLLSPTGPFKISGDTIIDTAANPIPVALTGRVDLSIRNKGPATIYYGNADVTADNDPVTGGWEIGAGEDFHVELDATQGFYLVTPAGQTAFAKFLEIAST